MNVEDLKAAAAKLPPEDRLRLADWLREDEAVCKAGHERLRGEIQKGVEQIERGEFTDCKGAEELHAFFAKLRARASGRLEAEQRPSAA